VVSHASCVSAGGPAVMWCRLCVPSAPSVNFPLASGFRRGPLDLVEMLGPMEVTRRVNGLPGRGDGVRMRSGSARPGCRPPRPRRRRAAPPPAPAGGGERPTVVHHVDVRRRGLTPSFVPVDQVTRPQVPERGGPASSPPSSRGRPGARGRRHRRATRDFKRSRSRAFLARNVGSVVTGVSFRLAVCRQSSGQGEERNGCPPAV
jgi:hypothetical protein